MLVQHFKHGPIHYRPIWLHNVQRIGRRFSACGFSPVVNNAEHRVIAFRDCLNLLTRREHAIDVIEHSVDRVGGVSVLWFLIA